LAHLSAHNDDRSPTDVGSEIVVAAPADGWYWLQVAKATPADGRYDLTISLAAPTATPTATITPTPSPTVTASPTPSQTPITPAQGAFGPPPHSLAAPTPTATVAPTETVTVTNGISLTLTYLGQIQPVDETLVALAAYRPLDQALYEDWGLQVTACRPQPALPSYPMPPLRRRFFHHRRLCRGLVRHMPRQFHNSLYCRGCRIRIGYKSRPHPVRRQPLPHPPQRRPRPDHGLQEQRRPARPPPRGILLPGRLRRRAIGGATGMNWPLSYANWRGMVQVTTNAALQIRHPIVIPSVVFGARNLSTCQSNITATRKISPSGRNDNGP
jgi:hypothetical protein